MTSKTGSIVGFLPCRAGSKRIPGKNTRPFAGRAGGLAALKLQHLLQCEDIDEIVVSTDDKGVMDLAESARSAASKPIHIVERPADLAISDSLDKFVAYIPTIVPEGHLCWVHATSPFFDAASLTRAVHAYKKNVLQGPHDSLMGVTKIHGFFWRGGHCISHDRAQTKWPQTQDIDPFFEVNSSVFMIDTSLMKKLTDRVGENPYLFETGKREAIDIDWPEDFEFAELLSRASEA